MGKRYFCDYCNRAFTDSAENRKKHLEGVLHQRNVKIHYDSFRDAQTILNEEQHKKPCRRFHQNGQCDFGSTCIYSHLTPDDFQKLQEQAWRDRSSKSMKSSSSTSAREPDLNKWLKTYRQKKQKSRQSSQGQSQEFPAMARLRDLLGCSETHSASNPDNLLPPFLKGIPNLPPSLLPWPPDALLKAKIENWG